jgi:hypothetical protein
MPHRQSRPQDGADNMVKLCRASVTIAGFLDYFQQD